MAPFKQIIKFINNSKPLKVILAFSGFFILLTIFCCNGYSQSYILFGDKTIGGSREEFSGLLLRKANSFILTGISRTNFDGDKTDSLCTDLGPNIFDGWLVEIDSSLNIINQMDLGGNNVESYFPFSDESVNTNQYLVALTSQSDSSCDKSEMSRGASDYWICNFDTSGTLLWQKTFGGNITEAGVKLVQTLDENIWICGKSSSSISGDKTVANFGADDYWIVKTDEYGNKIWDKVFGSTGSESSVYGGLNLIPYDSTGIIMIGNSNGPNDGLVSDTCRGLYDIWVVNIDSAGNKIWDNRFGGNSMDIPTKIINTNDSNYIISGFTMSQQSGEVSEPSLGDWDFWIVKMDPNGNIIWDHRYGGSGDDKAYWIEKADNGGFWIAGSTTSGIGGHISEPPYGTKDYWIIKIDSVGNKLWDKRFGGPGENELTSFAILADSSILLFGYADTGTSAVKTDFGKGMTDYWLVHFKYSDSTTSIAESFVMEYDIFPNPVISSFTIKADQCIDCNFVISDVSGKILTSKILTKKLEIDMTEFSSGVYFFEIVNQDRFSQQGKIIKL